MIGHSESCAMEVLSSSVTLGRVFDCVAKENPTTLKIASLAALDRIAKHNADLAQTIVTASELPYIVCLLSSTHTNIKVQRGALALIRDIVRHCLSLSENAIEADLFPTILVLMGSPDELVRNEAAKVVGEMVKQSVQISQLVVNAGGIAALMNVIKLSKEHCCLPAVIAIGYIAISSPLLASVIIQSDVLLPLNGILENDDDEFLKAGVIWALGLIGKHSCEHSRAVCTTGNVVCIMTEILPTNAKARRSFILDGHLKRIQQYSPAPDTEMYKILQGINCCFPEDIVQRATGDFPESVMQTVDKYQPKSNCVFYSRHPKSNELNNSDNSSHEEEATFE
ncbi:sperm-associated antigen 6-like [Adelges cooleyi]|uniref:sperm-associated antigen 6-like n=1 Tax=Adelges cooleyi TaxID=133065 RepID=UPI00217FAEBF|nr:sperm-associated antigen 6-like [Adelges cooleyi]